MLSENPVVTLLVVVAVVALVWVVYQEWTKEHPVIPAKTLNPTTTEVPTTTEGFETHAPAEDTMVASSVEGFVDPAEDEQESEPKPVATDAGNNANQLPSECYPKDVLNSVDLLPRDANSLHAQVNPNTQGALTDQNFLTAGYHIGINTVGQTLRNANRQLRSEPPNPQVKVSPWNQTTIETDVNRRPLEIGGQ